MALGKLQKLDSNHRGKYVKIQASILSVFNYIHYLIEANKSHQEPNGCIHVVV